MSATEPTEHENMTIFSKPDGTVVTVTHTKPLAEALGPDLLAQLKWWHSGTVKYGNE